MIRKTWVIVIVGLLLSVSLLGKRAVATGAADRKKIIMVLDSTDLWLLKLLLWGSGIQVVHTLSLINALAIEAELASLLNVLNFASMLGVSVVGVFDDLAVSVPPIIPALPGEIPRTEMYDWGLERIGVNAARQEMPKWTGAGVTVAILDTGVDCTHSDLPRIVKGFNALPGGGLFCDYHGHGTHMAGIIAARVNGLGIMGAAPQVSIAAVKVLDATGKGHLSDLINGLQWVYDNQIRLVNMSLGFPADSRPLQQAIKSLYDRDIIMVASAGNSCSDSPGQDEAGEDEGEGATACYDSQNAVKYPARYPQVLAVTATDFDNYTTNYSRTGPQVDVTAPGGVWTGARILSTDLGGGYGYGSGTSQAAAHVTGALALKLQQQPQIGAGQMKELLQQTATDLGYPRTQQGWGLVDVERLLQGPNK